MKTYYVEIHCVVEVEADDAEEAETTARELDYNDLVWDADIIGEEE